MRGINKANSCIQTRNPIVVKRVHPRRKNYLKIMRQKEIDAIVELTRNQLMDRYDG